MSVCYYHPCVSVSVSVISVSVISVSWWMRAMFLSVLTAVYLHSLILRVITAIPPEVKQGGCIKVNRCKCLMRDGSGIIDLGSVAGEDGFIQRLEPVTPAAPGNTEVLVSFSPCVPFSEPEDFTVTDCTDVAACVTTR